MIEELDIILELIHRVGVGKNKEQLDKITESEEFLLMVIARGGIRNCPLSYSKLKDIWKSLDEKDWLLSYGEAVCRYPKLSKEDTLEMAKIIHFDKGKINPITPLEEQLKWMESLNNYIIEEEFLNGREY